MKKAISTLLALAMVLSMTASLSVTAFASNTQDYSLGTDVLYDVWAEESYSVTVPALMAPGDTGTVTVEGQFPSNKEISVTADSSVVLTNSILAADKKTLDITFDGIQINGSNTEPVSDSATISVENISKALFGDWEGHFDYTVDFGEPPVTVTTADELHAAINNGEAVVMMNDITVYGGDDTYFGTEETELISIDGNGHTLTFDNVHPNGVYTFTIIRTTNPDATLSINNANITRTNQEIRHWTNNLTFACNTTLSNVEFVNQNITLDGIRDDRGFTYTFNHVNINDTRIGSEHYALWITAGQTVNLNGCNISVAGSGDRAIKISDEQEGLDEYAQPVDLTITNSSFKSGKKAAVLVSSEYGANIALSNVDISAVAADTINVVWVDSDYAAYADKVAVSGGTKIIEN